MNNHYTFNEYKKQWSFKHDLVVLHDWAIKCIVEPLN